MCRNRSSNDAAFSFGFLQLSGNGQLAHVIALLLLVCICGCGPRRANPVDRELADRTLVRALDAWKGGGTIAELKSADDPIIVQEAFWTSSKTLESYQLVGDGWIEDANLYREVELTIAGDQNQKTIQVTYVIGTDPVLTVFRAIL